MQTRSESRGQLTTKKDTAADHLKSAQFRVQDVRKIHSVIRRRRQAPASIICTWMMQEKTLRMIFAWCMGSLFIPQRTCFWVVLRLCGISGATQQEQPQATRGNLDAHDWHATADSDPASSKRVRILAALAMSPRSHARALASSANHRHDTASKQTEPGSPRARARRTLRICCASAPPGRALPASPCSAPLRFHTGLWTSVSRLVLSGIFASSSQLRLRRAD